MDRGGINRGNEGRNRAGKLSDFVDLSGPGRSHSRVDRVGIGNVELSVTFAEVGQDSADKYPASHQGIVKIRETSKFSCMPESGPGDGAMRFLFLRMSVPDFVVSARGLINASILLLACSLRTEEIGPQELLSAWNS
jgi:hypothetical protein